MTALEFELTHGEIDCVEQKLDAGFSAADKKLDQILAVGDKTHRLIEALRDIKTASLHRHVERIEKKLDITS